MMWKTNRYAYASALPAIAAALALSSTPAWSQEAQPTAEPAPVTVDTPAPVVDTTPTTTVTDTNVADPAPAVETTTATAVPAAKAKAKAKAKSTAAKPAKAASKPATTTHVASAAPAAAAAPVAAAPVAPAATPQPIVDSAPVDTAQAAPAPEAKPLPVDENALMLGGGALALLALGGGAYAMTRRRRDEDEFVEETAMDEPVAATPEPAVETAPVYEEQPAIVVPSAFAWGNSQPAESYVERQTERNDGETWVERAHRGPTPENPSLSLRKRLKRAAFFDAREKRVEAGKAEPVANDAGLPENAANDTIRERELELA